MQKIKPTFKMVTGCIVKSSFSATKHIITPKIQKLPKKIFLTDIAFYLIKICYKYLQKVIGNIATRNGKMFGKSGTNYALMLRTNNHGNNIMRPFYILPNFSFTTSEMKRDY